MNYSSFDPWTASKEEKREIYEKYLAALIDEIDKFEASGEQSMKTSPSQEQKELEIAYEKLDAWGFIVDLQSEIENEKNELAGRMILESVKRALQAKITAPDWLTNAFSMRVDAVLFNKAKHWNDTKSFGRERKRGTQMNNENRSYQIGHMLDEMMRHYNLPAERDSYIDIKERLLTEIGSTKMFGIDKLSDSGLEKIHQQYKRTQITKPAWLEKIFEK